MRSILNCLPSSYLLLLTGTTRTTGTSYCTTITLQMRHLLYKYFSCITSTIEMFLQSITTLTTTRTTRTTRRRRTTTTTFKLIDCDARSENEIIIIIGLRPLSSATSTSHSLQSTHATPTGDWVRI